MSSTPEEPPTPAPEIPPDLREALIEMWTQILCAEHAEPAPEEPKP